MKQWIFPVPRHFICHRVHFHKILYCCCLIDICILHWANTTIGLSSHMTGRSLHLCTFGMVFCFVQWHLCISLIIVCILLNCHLGFYHRFRLQCSHKRNEFFKCTNNHFPFIKLHPNRHRLIFLPIFCQYTHNAYVHQTQPIWQLCGLTSLHYVHIWTNNKNQII